MVRQFVDVATEEIAADADVVAEAAAMPIATSELSTPSCLRRAEPTTRCQARTGTGGEGGACCGHRHFDVSMLRRLEAPATTRRRYRTWIRGVSEPSCPTRVCSLPADHARRGKGSCADGCRRSIPHPDILGRSGHPTRSRPEGHPAVDADRLGGDEARNACLAQVTNPPVLTRMTASNADRACGRYCASAESACRSGSNGSPVRDTRAYGRGSRNRQCEQLTMASRRGAPCARSNSPCRLHRPGRRPQPEVVAALADSPHRQADEQPDGGGRAHSFGTGSARAGLPADPRADVRPGRLERVSAAGDVDPAVVLDAGKPRQRDGSLARCG